MSLPSRQVLFVIAPLALMLACGQNQAGRQQTGARQNQPAANTSTAGSSDAQHPNAQSSAQPSAQSQASAADSPQAPTNNPANVIPEFTFYVLRSGIRFEKADLTKEEKHVFILFDPGCTYCQYEARDIGKNIDKFEKTNFYFVSMNDPALMSTFFATYAKELVDKPNVHMLYDRNVHFINKFHVPSQYPATYVYTGNHLLKTYWNGMKSPEEIVRAIRD